jgi:phosphoribosylformimino-5-aminoimidazole carboxamide ribotide isomerase
MNLYPAIDLYEGQVVRLQKGDFDKRTVYSKDPSAFAKKWEDAGASWIHVVDLEGAKTGKQKNLQHLLKIRKSVKCRIQFGGGLRSVETIDSVLKQGIDRVVVGTKAMDLSFLEEALPKFGKKIAIGLDVRDGVVQTQGWLDAGNPTLRDALDQLNNFNVETVIYTDIQKDGMLEGPNFGELEKVLKSTKARVILSGGISQMEDLRKCREIRQKNFDGVIVGKALYEDKVNLTEALKL